MTIKFVTIVNDETGAEASVAEFSFTRVWSERGWHLKDSPVAEVAPDSSMEQSVEETPKAPTLGSWTKRSKGTDDETRLGDSEVSSSATTEESTNA